jgi:hypothetical protein
MRSKPSVAWFCLALAGCSSSSPKIREFVPGGGLVEDGGAVTFDAGSFAPFAPPSDPGAGGIVVTASGEDLALKGFQFPPQDPANDTYMVDGWNFQIDEYLAVFDHVTLWSNPNTVPTDPSQHGGVVAHADGPWVVDLHKGGPYMGKGGGGEQAVGIVAIAKKDDGSSFDEAQSYGFGFSTVAAPRAGARNVNLDASEVADYEAMVENGYSVFYVGTATWAGTESMFGCTETQVVRAGADASVGGNADADAGASAYDFSKIPTTIRFRLGFSTPTDYVNCQNGTDLSGPGVNGEDHPRGVQVKPNQSIAAQVTIHMDHPFWESFAENSPLHWDPIAAQYVGIAGTPEAHTEDMKGVNFLAFTDKAGTPLSWRNCRGTFYTPPGNGQVFFDPLTVPVNPASPCVPGNCPALRDYYDYMRYTQSTQGHLNSQGLCFVSRRYPAPGGASGK